MKLLIDQDVYAITVRFLIELGHDILQAEQIGLSRASDSDLLIAAQQQRRILVTRDRDFGNLIFVRKDKTGVIYLRMLPSSLKLVHAELDRVLKRYSEDDLRQAFVVIQPNGHRIRRL